MNFKKFNWMILMIIIKDLGFWYKVNINIDWLVKLILFIIFGFVVINVF